MIDILAESLIYSVFLMGMSTLYIREIKEYSGKIKTGRRLKERKRQMKETSKLEQHFDSVAKLTINLKGKYLTYFMGIIFLSVMIVGGRSLSLKSVIFLSAAMASTPYIILRIKFEGIRRKGSFEGEMLISNFLNQYRISGFNVYEGLEKLLEESRNTRVSNSLILKMLLDLRSTGSPKEIKKAVDKFAKVINTNWSRMFAYNIQMAAEKGINISPAIEDILLQLRDARTVYEERKRLNSESIRIVIYMIPLLYAFTVIMSVKYVGISLFHYIENQLFTKEGFMFLTVSGVMFLMNIAIMEIVSKQKFDY